MLHHLGQHCAVVEYGVLRRLESRPTAAKEAECRAVQPGHLDDQTAIRLQSVMGVNQRAHRIIVMLQVMPHGDQVKSLTSKFLLIEQAAPELHMAEGREFGEVHEIHSGDGAAMLRMNALQKCACAATDIQ